jgi:hypothetical protein
MITIGHSARLKPMTSPENSMQQRDEAAWLDLRKRLLHIEHSTRFAALLRRRPALLERCQPGVFVVESAENTACGNLQRIAPDNRPQPDSSVRGVT